MLFIILPLIFIFAGWLLYEFIDEFCLPASFCLAVFVFFIGPMISEFPCFYDTVENTESLTTFSDNIYYQNENEEKNVTLCIVDNDKVSHIEIIHYKNLQMEYMKDTSSAMVTINTYKRKPKYKWIVYDRLTGDVANVTLQLPESAKEK